jgi:uncharacterized protein (TIGR03435 family)
MDRPRFEITAKLPPGVSLDQIPEMLQILLAERFKLTLRHDSKEQSVYALAVVKGGPKLKPAETKEGSQVPTAVGPDGKPRRAMMFKFLPSGVRLLAPATTLASFVELMSRFTERPVVDLTGIEGQFDLELTFAPETTRGVLVGDNPAPDIQSFSEPAPSVFQAVQQYGLNLERRKVPMELLTITNVAKSPTEN